MKRSHDPVERIPDVLDGMKVETWLRRPVLKSMLSEHFLPNVDGRISDAIGELKEDSRRKIILILINARTKASAQKDFFGVSGIPIGLGLITVVVAFNLSAPMILFCAVVLLFYLFLYYYYRLMQAAEESILDSLRIASEYRI